MPTILREQSLELARKKYPVAFKFLYFIMLLGLVSGLMVIAFGFLPQ